MAGSGQVIKNMYGWATALKFGPSGIEALARVTAANMQNYARTNYRWKPQTGKAHGGLHGGSFWDNPFMLMVFIAHSVEYGIYLELAHDRKYQILEEARDKFKDSFFQGIKKIMEH